MCTHFTLVHTGNGFHSMVTGVYPDSSTMGVLVHHNVFYMVGSNAHPTDARAIMGNGFSDVVATNNIFVDCTIPFELNDWFLESWGAGNFPAYSASWKFDFDTTAELGMLQTFMERYPPLRTFFQDDRKAPKSNVFNASIVYNPTLSRAVGNASVYGYECASCALNDVAHDGLWCVRRDLRVFCGCSGVFQTREITVHHRCE